MQVTNKQQAKYATRFHVFFVCAQFSLSKLLPHIVTHADGVIILFSKCMSET